MINRRVLRFTSVLVLGLTLWVGSVEPALAQEAPVSAGVWRARLKTPAAQQMSRAISRWTILV